jgi:Bacteriophage clamp loader A subunit
VSDLFKDILPSILQNKKYVLDNEKDYNAYVVNKALSFHYDTVLQCNQMNLYPNLPANMQYQYLLNKVRGYKRPYQKWVKRETTEDLGAIKEYYGYSDDKAKDVIVLLNDAQLEEIKKRLYKGGTNDSKPRRLRGGETT